MSDPEPIVSEGTDPTAAPKPGWGPWIRSVVLWPPFLVGALVLGAALWLFEPFGEKTTLGRIFVDTPEIYTRERLVNDRFLQDAWLARELERESINPGRQTFSDRRDTAFRAGGPGEGTVPAKAADPAKPGDGDKDPEVRQSDRALLLEKVDYRDVVRNLAIENQLDDRHDLNGNSLYRLKFDAAVLPGANTQASAQINIRLLGPPFISASPKNGPLRSLPALGSLENIASWRKIYSKWIENLGSRLNQTQKELKQAFHNNEFAHNDYARLMAFLSRNLKVPPKDVGACAPHLVEPQGHDRKPFRLPTQEHVARKTCITALIEKTIVKPAYVVTPNPKPTLGEYLRLPSESKRAAQDIDAERFKLVNDVLTYWLNSYCATKTVQLVLGLPVPESSFVGRGYYDIPALQTLVKLTFFNPYPKSSEEDAFTVKQRVAAIAAIDPKVTADGLKAMYDAKAEYWAQLYETRSNPMLSRHEDYAANLLPKVRLNVSRIDLKEIENDDIDLTEGDFKDVVAGAGVRVARAEVGLLNFARSARKHVLAFTYSVTPKESSDSVNFTFSTDSKVEGQTPLPAESGSAALRMRREVISRTLERRNAVVGFSAFRNDGSAEFGWLISPRHMTIDGQRHVQVQTPGQYPLSALVSLPSWWNQVQLEVTTSWVDWTGNIKKETSSSAKHVVDVPTDFEPLEAILLGIEQLGPELMESRLDPVLLTACRPGAIVIPGRRLWRSTKVTLGYQTADSIAVLPNMKGIIARFDKVQNQLSVSEAEERRKGGPLEIPRAVRVWTSQGSLTLPTPARIGIPDDCLEPRKSGEARP